ncbi:MAG: nitrite/sulfite reductase [Acidimicrobiaceae bacterium]|nr:nitrite/sulfite reductase [Acidimicrobiaceae bacterium]
MTLLESRTAASTPPGPPPARGPVDPEIRADVDKYRQQYARFLSGELSDDVFRVYRLTNGIYGQRQGGTNQMVRVKVPYGSIQPDQLEMLGWLVDAYSRGWGHITTRQNIQFHFVQLDRIPEVLEHLASVGLTTREACGDTVRNVQGCHLAGACPHEVLDITPWAEATYRHFVRNPISQRLPRKFKINFSGCESDCGQAMFNDVGVIGVARRTGAGELESGFKVFIAGGLGTTPHPALALEDFTPREELLPTVEACLRVFDQAGNRDNKLRARMKWLVDTLGFEEVQRRVLTQRKFLVASTSWPGGIPAEVLAGGDDPAGEGDDPAEITAIGHGTPVTLGTGSPYERWERANVVRGVRDGTVSVYAQAHLGDITGDQFRALAALQRDLGSDVRLTNRQNVVFRGLHVEDLPLVFDRLQGMDMAQPGAELSRDVVACPGSDTCNLAVTQSRGLGHAIGERLESEGLAEVGGVRINISGCPNSCGQHHASDIGFFGAERRVRGRSAPGYQMLLGGHVGDQQMHFGERALRLPARNAPEATARVIRRFIDERRATERFRDWMQRVGGARAVAEALKDLDEFPDFDDDPSFYVDYDEAGPYTVETGASECAT